MADQVQIDGRNILVFKDKLSIKLYQQQNATEVANKETNLSNVGGKRNGGIYDQRTFTASCNFVLRRSLTRNINSVSIPTCSFVN